MTPEKLINEYGETVLCNEMMLGLARRFIRTRTYHLTEHQYMTHTAFGRFVADWRDEDGSS